LPGRLALRSALPYFPHFVIAALVVLFDSQLIAKRAIWRARYSEIVVPHAVRYQFSVNNETCARIFHRRFHVVTKTGFRFAALPHAFIFYHIFYHL